MSGRCILLLVVLLSTSCSENNEIILFAGSIVEKPFEKIIRQFEKEHGVSVNAQYSGSGMALSMMEVSERGDVFISGSQYYYLVAQRKNLVCAGTKTQLASSNLCIIIPSMSEPDQRDVGCLKGRKICIGNEKSVCIGRIAIEYIEDNNLNALVENNEIIRVESCMKLIVAVTSGACDLAFGLDAYGNISGGTLLVVPLKNAPKVTIVGGVSRYSKHRRQAEAFLKYLSSPAARRIFTEYGFECNL